MQMNKKKKILNHDKRLLDETLHEQLRSSTKYMGD